MKARWKKWSLSLLLVLVWLGAFCPPLGAQAIIAPSGRALFNRASLIRSFVEVRHLSLRGPDGTTVDITQYITPLAFVYAFRPKWQVIVAQPYIIADVTRRSAGGSMRQDLNGLGDGQVILQYDGLYSRNAPGGLTRLSGLFGLTLPTGADRFSTGAVAYTGGLIFEKVSGLKYAFTGDFEYTFASENGQGLSAGDRAQFDAVPAYFLMPRGDLAAGAGWARRAFHRMFSNGVYAIVELNGNWQGRARASGIVVPNSGGTTLSLSPGIQYFVGRRLIVEFSAPIPVVRDLNGVQPRPDWTFLLGFRWLF